MERSIVYENLSKLKYEDIQSLIKTKGLNSKNVKILLDFIIGQYSKGKISYTMTNNLMTLILQNYKLTQHVILEYLKFFHPSDILKYQKLSEAFLQRNIKKFTPNSLLYYQTLSESFLRKNFDYLLKDISYLDIECGDGIFFHLNNFDIILYNKSKRVSEKFIDDYFDNFRLDLLIHKKYLTDKITLNHIDKILHGKYARFFLMSYVSDSLLPLIYDKISDENKSALACNNILSNEIKNKYEIYIL